MASAVLKLSASFGGQLQFESDDAWFRFNSGMEGKLSEDLHIVNQDEAYEVCSKVAEKYSLSVTEDALARLGELTDSHEPSTPSFHAPFDLKKFQCRMLNVMDGKRGILVQSSPGTGKTAMGCFLAARAIDRGDVDRVIVFCPSALVQDWVREVGRLTSLTVATVNKSHPAPKRREFYETDGSQVWVLNYERVRTGDYSALEKVLKGSRTLFVYDEAQKVKGRSSALHRNIAKLSRRPSESWRVALTATPIVRGPEDFYNEFRIIAPERFGTVRDFERRFTYNFGERDIWGNYIGYVNLPYMHLMAGDVVFSADKTREEIAREFPSKHEILLEYDLSPQEEKLYREILGYGASLGGEFRQGALFMLTFMRLCNMPEVLLKQHAPMEGPYGEQQERIDAICQRHASAIRDSANSAKLELVREKVEEITSSGEKLIIFAQHTHNCLFPLARHLEAYSPLLYTGEQSDAEKEAVKGEFKSNPDRRLLLMSDAGQVGLNFQECRYVLHYQTPVSHAAYEQRSDRIHRIDSDFDSVTVFRLMARGTVEERVEDTMQGRRMMAVEMGLSGEYEEYGQVTQADADWFCGF